MAIIIGTDSSGYVTYVNQPETNKSLSKNDNYLPEEAKEEITDDYKAYVNNIISNPSENDIVDLNHILYTKNFAQAGVPIVSSPTDGNRVGFAAAISLNTLNLSVQNGSAGSAFTTRAITLGGSDKRMKENIKPCDASALDLINKLNVVQFDWIDTKKHWNYGIIAQDAKKIDDNIVTGEETEDCYLGIDTLYMVDILLKAVQELSTEIKQLKEKGV